MRIVAGMGGVEVCLPFLLRGLAIGSSSPSPSSLVVTGEFWAQHFIVGEIESVCALFGGDAPWTAASAAFTLFDQGETVGGFDAVSAVLAEDDATEWTASYSVDFTAGAAYPVPPGDYVGMFRVVAAGGQAFEAFGNVTVLEPSPAPEVGDDEVTGGVGD